MGLTSKRVKQKSWLKSICGRTAVWHLQILLYFNDNG